MKKYHVVEIIEPFCDLTLYDLLFKLCLTVYHEAKYCNAGYF
jgi:hypothetical protein